MVEVVAVMVVEMEMEGNVEMLGTIQDGLRWKILLMDCEGEGEGCTVERCGKVGR